MSCDLLVEFSRTDQQSDWFESASNFCLTPLRLACGRTVVVDHAKTNPFLDQEQTHWVGRIALAIISFIPWLPLTLIGLTLCLLSSTHFDISTAYQNRVHSIALSEISGSHPQQADSTRSRYPRGLLPTDPFPGERRRQLPELTPQEITEHLSFLAQSWYENPHEMTLEGFASLMQFWEPGTLQYLLNLNAQICRRVKQEASYEITTPEEFLWPLKGASWTIERPKPVMGHGRMQILQEDTYYGFNPISKRHPLRTVDSERIHQDEASFDPVIKRNGERLYLFADGLSEGSGTFVNNHYFPSTFGRGPDIPLSSLHMGDDVYAHQGGLIYFLFTVGPNGTIIYPNGHRSSPPGISPAAQRQTNQFERDVNTLHLFKTGLTTHIQSAEIGPQTHLESGFSFYSEITPQPLSSPFAEASFTRDRGHIGDVVYFDLSQDSVLQQILDYFKAEFEVMEYTEEEKVVRLATFCATLMHRTEFDPAVLNQSYLIGELARSGTGACRHLAPLFKLLSDHLGLRSGLVASVVDKTVYRYTFDQTTIETSTETSGHVWNVVELEDGRHWLVDPMKRIAFPVSAPPGSTLSYQNHLTGYYGLEHLQKKEQRLPLPS